MHTLFESTVNFHEKHANGKILFEIVDLYEEMYSSKEASMELSTKSNEIYKSKLSKKTTLVLYLKEKDKNLIIYFLNNEKEKSRLLYQNINQESLQTMGSLFKSMVMNIKKDIFSYFFLLLDELIICLLNNTGSNICALFWMN